VNGRALLSGVRLKKLEASEMLDVLHALFEEDNSSSTDVEYKVKQAVRSTLYREFYGIDQSGGEFSEYSDQTAGGPQTPTVSSKPYIPPTPVDADSPRPFGAALDSPVG